MKRSTKFFLFGLGIGLGLSARELLKHSKQVTQTAGPIVFDWLGKGVPTADLAAELEASGKRNLQQLMEKMPTKHNYNVLNHLIGIEKWGQQRLRVALGDGAFVLDEHDDYRPRFGLSWNELQDVFSQTRIETLELAERIDAAEKGGERVLHNDFGEISANHWLHYLRLHANGELWKMN
ncbi:MAG: hypothetical protein AB8G95_26620 [Anaerolineae bacterium]